MKSIESRDNPFYKQLRRLAESGRERKKTGLMLLDGLHLITALQASGQAPEAIMVSTHGLQQQEIADWLGSPAADGIPLVQLSDALMRDLGIVDQPSGIVALAAMPVAELAPDNAQDCLLLDGVQDPGNLGTLLRTAAAAGVRQALLSPECAGAWSPKVLRAGQGAHFALQIYESADLAAFLGRFAGRSIVTQLQDAQPLYALDLRAPLAWVFGSEGRGVRPELSALANERAFIPMPGQVESLNVGAAAAICLFEAVRQRQLR